MKKDGEEKNETTELVVLVDESDTPIGTHPKATLHTKDTPLHRAFSMYIFNLEGKVLVQQRSQGKIAWGGFWSNSCCGHPTPGETREQAAKRRPGQELGIEVSDIQEVEPYRYRFEHNNVVENEVCPIFVSVTRDEVVPVASEIQSFKWLSWSRFMRDIEENRQAYTPWSQEQVTILEKSEKFKNWLAQNSIKI